MHKILVIRLYFPLDALHVSDSVSPSTGANFISCTSHLVYADTSGCCVAIATQKPDLWYRHIHTVRRCTVYTMLNHHISLLCSTQYSYVVLLHVANQYAQKVLFHFNNNVYAKDPHCLFTRTYRNLFNLLATDFFFSNFNTLVFKM